MAFQIRHREFGVFQGECMGMGFWHPMSDMPEQGFCEFPTLAEAEQYIAFLAGEEPHYGFKEMVDTPLKRDDLSVEPFDARTSRLLIEEWAGRYDKATA